MAERRVSWNAVANFAAVRREAERTSRSLKDLEDRSDSLGNTSEDSADKITRSNERTAKSREADSRAARDQTTASSAAASALDREGRSSSSLGGMLSRLGEARRKESSAARDQTAAGRALAAAQAAEAKASEQLARANLALEQSRLRLTRAEQASERANRNLAVAQRDAANATGDNTAKMEALASAQQRAAARSNDLALAQTRVEQSTRSVTRATTDHEHASNRASDAVRRMGSDSDRSGGGLRRLSSNLHEARDAAKGFGVALTMLKFTAMAAGIAHLVPLLTQLVAGLYAVVGAIGPVVNAFAVLPQMLIGAGTAIGAVMAGFSGIGGALKAYGQQQAATGAKVARTQRDTSRAVRDAAEAVVRAREAAAEAAEDSAQRIADAEEAQAEAAVSSARRIADAKERQAEANASAARAVADASRQLAEAQRDEERALSDLNRAREEAINFLDDMSDRLRDASLSEEGAVLALEEAKIRLEKTMFNRTSSDLDRRKADLDYRMALARLDDAREAKAEAIEANAEAQAKGVEGSDIMVSANERVISSQQRTQDAITNLADAQANQAKVARDTAQAVADAEADAAKSARDTARAVAEAREDAAKSARDSARAIRDALENQVQASERAADALTGAAGGVNKFDEAMKKLSPAGQSFVRFLISLKGQLDELKARAQEAFLPGIERGLRTLTDNLAPMVGDAIVRMGKILGDGFSNFADVMGGGESKDILSRIFESNEVAARNTTAAMGPLYMGIMRIADAFRPLAEWLSELVLQFGNWLDVTTQVNTANGDLAESVTNARESLSLVGDILKNFGIILYNVGKGGRDTGMGLLEMFNAWLEKWADWTGSVEGQNSIKKYFEDARPGIEAAANLIGAIGRLFLDLGINPQTAEILNKLAGPGMDAVGRIIKALTESSIGTSLTDGIISIAEGIATLLESGGGGVLSAFVESLSMMFDILSKIVQIPGVGEVLSGVAVAVGTMKAARVVGAVTGITPMMRTTRKAVQTVRGSTSSTPPVDPTSSAAASATAGTGIMSMMPWSKKKPPPVSTPPPTAPLRSASSQSAPGATFWGSMGTTPKDTKRAPERKPSATVAKAGAAGKKFSVGKAGAAASVAAGIGAIINFAAPTAAAGVFGGVLSNLSSILFGIIPLMPLLAAGIGMLTWPITLVIGAIAAFVAGLVWLWNNNEGFRNFIIGAWDAIVAAVKGAWENYIWPALQALAAFIVDRVVPVFQMIWDVVQVVFGVIANVISWAWNNVIRPVFEALWGFITGTLVPVFQTIWDVVQTVFGFIGQVIAFAWNNIIRPVFEALWGFIRDTLVPIFQWFWNNLQVIFGFIGALIVFAWNNVIRPVFQAIWGFITGTLVPIFQWFHQAVNTVFGFIGALIGFAWNNVIRPIFQAIWGFITNTLGPVFNWLWKTIIQPAFDGISGAISWVWNNGIRPVLQAFGDFFRNTLVPAFQRGVEAITGAWNTVQSALARPINWVIDNVINRGIIDTFNSISKVIGGPTMTRASRIGDPASAPVSRSTAGGLQRAEGGPIYDPAGRRPRFAGGGRVRGQSLHKRQDNIDARLTAGEWVLPVDSVRYYGPRVMEMLRRRRLPRDFVELADGGEAPQAPMDMDAKGGVWETIKSAGAAAADIFTDPVAWAVRKLEGPVNALLNNIPGARGLVDWIKPMPKKLLSTAMTWVRNKATSWLGGDSPAGTDRGAMPWSAIWSMIKRVAPESRMTSNYRPGAITASGFPSKHGLGRAVDLVSPDMMRTFNKIRPLKAWTELYYSPAEYRQLLYGRAHRPSGITRAMHFNHIHAAMNQGGQVGTPKLGMPRYASGGPVLSPRTAGFSTDNFRATRLRGRANAMTRGNAAFGLAHNEDNRVTNVVTNVYNPLPERASDSVQRRLTRTAQLGLIGGRRSDT